MSRVARNGGSMNLFLLEDGRLRNEWRFVFSVVVVFAMNYAAGMLAATFGGGRPHLEDVIYRPLVMLLLLGGFAGMARVFDGQESGIPGYLGLPRRGWFRETLRGALMGFVLVFIAILVIAVFCQYDIVKFVLNPRTLKLPAVVVLILLTGAMAEELTFRGYPFQRLVDSLGKVGAIVVLSVLFGAVHLRNPHVSDNRAVQVFAFTNTILVGIVFAIAYLRTKALWFPWGLHFSWNITLGLIFGLPVSGITDFSVLVHARAHGPAWLLGGGYGIEGGALGTAVMLLGLTYVLLFVHPSAEKPKPHLDEPTNRSIQPIGTA